MEKYPIFMNLENWCCSSGHTNTNKSNLKIQCNLHQSPKTSFPKLEKNTSEMHTEALKTLNKQSNHGQNDQYWRHHNIWLQNILQTQSNKNSIVLQLKYTCLLTEWERTHKRFAYLHPNDSWQRYQKHTLEKRQTFWPMILSVEDRN